MHIPSLDKRSLKAEVCLVSCDHGSEAYIGGFLHFLYQFYSPAVFAISKYLPLAMRLCLDKKDVCPCVWRFPSFFVVPTFKAFQAMMHSAPSRFFLCMLCGLTASSNHAQETYDQWLMQAPIHRLTLRYTAEAIISTWYYGTLLGMRLCPLHATKKIITEDVFFWRLYMEMLRRKMLILM